MTRAAVDVRTKERYARMLRENLSVMIDAHIPGVDGKLLHKGLVDSEAAARRLLREVHRYLALCELRPDLSLPMFSNRVDEAWHQTVLFTAEYEAFCLRWFGHYAHHQPRESSGPTDAKRPASFADFTLAYEALFGPLSDEWRDELFLAPNTRLRWSEQVTPRFSLEGNRATLRDDRRAGTLLCRVDRRLAGSLAFMAEQPLFLLREIPAPHPRAPHALCQPLVRFRLLQIAP